MYDWYEIGFAGHTIKLVIPLGFLFGLIKVVVRIKPLPLSVFFQFSNLLEKPSGMTLYNLVQNPDSLKYWQRFKNEIDPKSKWLKQILNFHVKDFGIFKHIVLDMLIKHISPLQLFKTLCIMNGLVLYFDPPSQLLKTETEEFSSIDQDLILFVYLQKLEIKYMNEKKITLQNLKNVLNFVQYLYFCKSQAIQDAMVLVNSNLIPPEDKKKKKAIGFNIEKHYANFNMLMRSFGLTNPDDWYSSKSEKYRFRINGQDYYKALYDLFRPKKK